MALLAMVCNDTAENNRSWMTNATLQSIHATVDWSRHRLFVVDNGSVRQTEDIIEYWRKRIPHMQVIYNDDNRGQALATNQAWLHRRISGSDGPDEHVARCDNDIVFRTPGWLNILEDCVAHDPTIGIIGCKRKDILDSPNAPDGCWSKTSLKMLPHALGEQWMAVEPIAHVLGACQLTNAALLDKIGYLFQFGLTFGFEDCLTAVRCKMAGFYSCYAHGIEIDHIDPAAGPYQDWKNKVSGENMATFDRIVKEYQSGERSIFHGPFDDDLWRKPQ